MTASQSVVLLKVRDINPNVFQLQLYGALKLSIKELDTQAQCRRAFGSGVRSHEESDEENRKQGSRLHAKYYSLENKLVVGSFRIYSVFNI